jgi:hypothetical protein
VGARIRGTPNRVGRDTPGAANRAEHRGRHDRVGRRAAGVRRRAGRRRRDPGRRGRPAVPGARPPARRGRRGQATQGQGRHGLVRRDPVASGPGGPASVGRDPERSVLPSGEPTGAASIRDDEPRAGDKRPPRADARRRGPSLKHWCRRAPGATPR